MERKTAGFLAAVLCGALLAGGCAKHEMVKQEEPIAPAATVAPAQAQQAQYTAQQNQYNAMINGLMGIGSAMVAAPFTGGLSLGAAVPSISDSAIY